MSNNPKQTGDLFGHPRGLSLLFFTEMWERFSYYGMRAIFTLFMVKALGFDKAMSSNIYGTYTGLVYLTPLIGGYIADQYWGNRRSIIVGGLLMALGQFLLFMSASSYQTPAVALPFFWAGLAGLIIGNGFFKPNISSMVGQLYQEGDKRVDAAFTIFYMGINLGAFFSPLVCGTLGDTGDPADFKWGFLAACIGMILGLGLFIALKDKFVITPDGRAIGGVPSADENKGNGEAPTKTSFSTPQLLVGIAGTALLTVAFIFGFGLDIWGGLIFSLSVTAPVVILMDESLTKIERDRIIVVIVMAFFVIFFWMAFEQAGASLTFFADEQTDRNLFGWNVPASYFQSINPLAIVLLAPVFAGLWVSMGKKNREPSSLVKQALGLLLLAIGYIVIAMGVKGISPEAKVSMFWLFSMYLLHTIGELCLSPIGLSMVVKLSPLRFTSLMMGVWFLSTSAANKLAGTLSAFYPQPMVPTEIVAKVKGMDKVGDLVKVNSEAKPENIEGKDYYTLEAISYSDIKDDNLRESVVKELKSNILNKTKNFFGFKINSLYSFFIIFVILSGIAGIILLMMSKKLEEMMHGK